MALTETNKIVSKKSRISFILLGLLLGGLVWSLFFLIDYLANPDPELERGLLFLAFVGISGFISVLVPLKPVDGLISGSLYSVLLYIVLNLIQVFYLIKLGILKEVWEPQYLSSYLLSIPIALGCSFVGIAVKHRNLIFSIFNGK